MKYGTKKLIKIDSELKEVSRKKRIDADGKISLYEIGKAFLILKNELPTDENIQTFIKDF